MRHKKNKLPVHIARAHTHTHNLLEMFRFPVHVILAMVGQFYKPSLRDKESLTIRGQTANSSGHAINKTAFVG